MKTSNKEEECVITRMTWVFFQRILVDERCLFDSTNDFNDYFKTNTYLTTEMNSLRRVHHNRRANGMSEYIWNRFNVVRFIFTLGIKANFIIQVQKTSKVIVHRTVRGDWASLLSACELCSRLSYALHCCMNQKIGFYDAKDDRWVKWECVVRSNIGQ